MERQRTTIATLEKWEIFAKCLRAMVEGAIDTEQVAKIAGKTHSTCEHYVREMIRMGLVGVKERSRQRRIFIGWTSPHVVETFLLQVERDKPLLVEKIRRRDRRDWELPERAARHEIEDDVPIYRKPTIVNVRRDPLVAVLFGPADIPDKVRGLGNSAASEFLVDELFLQGILK